MYWRISSFLELQHLSEEDRARLLREHIGWRTPVWIVVRSLLLGLSTGMVAAILTSQLLSRFPSAILPFWAGYFVVFSLVTYQFQLIWIRGALRVFLEEQAKYAPLPLCINCGYDVQGLVSDRCPECGYLLRDARHR